MPLANETDPAGRRVALVLPDLRGGGAERVAVLLAQEFLRRGCKVDFVLAQARGELLEEIAGTCRVIDLAAPRLRSVLPPLRRYLREETPDAVLASMWPLSAIAGLAAATTRPRCWIVTSEHNDFRTAAAIKPIERHLLYALGPILYRPAGRVIAVSRGVADSLQACARLDSSKTRVIHNPIRPPTGKLFEAEDAPLISWWRQGGPRLLTVGTLKPVKAQDVLIRAVGELREHPSARLVILGEGPERASLQALIEREGLSERVKLPGFRHDPFPYLAEADLFVLSSTSEGFGNVLVEAMACGTPVVSTDCPYGPREILRDGALGRLAPVGDAAALARTIDAALAEPAESEALRRRAADFAPERIADAYVDALFGPAR